MQPNNHLGVPQKPTDDGGRGVEDAPIIILPKA